MKCYLEIFKYKIFIINLIILLQNINPVIVEECGTDIPFLKNGNCVDSCTKSEFESNECEISNSIIKIKWITNIIPFGDKNFNYVKIAYFSNNDMIAITTSDSSNKRMFYGLKENGRYYFTQNSNETPYYTFEIDNAARKEAELFVIKLNDNGKEYLVSFANGNGYAELYDFENKVFYIKKTSDIFSNLNSNAVNSFALSYTSSNKYYTLFGCLHPNNTYQSAYIYKLNFNTVNITNNDIDTKFLISENSIGYGISCDINVPNNQSIYYGKNMFICVYLYNLNKSDESSKKYHFIILNESLDSSIGNYSINAANVPDTVFFKIINIGTFYEAFFYYLNNSTLHINFLIHNELKETISLNSYREEINLDRYYFNNYMSLNDVVKVNNEKFCFISTDENKERLIIVIIEIYSYSGYSHLIKYNSIEMFKFHNFKFFKNIAAHIYNDFISLAASYCNTSSCSSDSDEHYSSLMIFNYPNATDINISLEEYLFNHDYITMDNLTLAILENIKIENNIFGCSFFGYLITKIKTSDNIELVLFYQESFVIPEGNKHTLDSIKIKFLNESKIFNCEVSYYPMYVEPRELDYKKYYTYVDSYNYIENLLKYERNTYNGRESIFNLTSTKELTDNCTNKNCSLCYLNSKNICFRCKTEKFEIKIKNGIKTKICEGDVIEEEEELIEKDLCTNEQILNNTCDKNITNEQLGEIYNILVDDYLKINETVENTIIRTGNIIFQISTLEDQKNSINSNVSSVDLGECEEILKKNMELVKVNL